MNAVEYDFLQRGLFAVVAPVLANGALQYLLTLPASSITLVQPQMKDLISKGGPLTSQRLMITLFLWWIVELIYKNKTDENANTTFAGCFDTRLTSWIQYGIRVKSRFYRALLKTGLIIRPFQILVKTLPGKQYLKIGN